MSDQPSRLSQIPTLWSVVRTAHEDDAPTAMPAKEQLLATYGGAAKRYLLAALRNHEAADDVFQDFSLKFLRGDFRNVSPDKGKFRQFLKTCLYRMIVDYQRRQKKQPIGGLPIEETPAERDETPDVMLDSAFVKSWRDELLSRSWQKLKDDEQSTGKPYHTILRLRAEHAESSSAELAAIATEKLGREISTANIRVLVHRARELFAECLLICVGDSLPARDREQIEEELIELHLLDYCRETLDRLR